MLRLENVSASYGAIQALEGVSLEVPNGKIVCLLGANGAGKSTTLNCISGVVPITAGRIVFNDETVSGMGVNRIVGHGMIPADLERVLEYFPRLRQRAKQAAGTLSGGEQQMLMIGRALMAKPKLLLLDEPSLGLSPVLIENLFAIIEKVHQAGVPILLVEQNARMALAVSDYGYILENGEIKLHGSAADLASNPQVQEAYLGAG